MNDIIRDKELRQITEEGAVSTSIGNMEEQAAREEGRCVPARRPTASTGGGVVSNHQHSPLPWRLVIGPIDKVVDSAGQAVCDNEDYYPMPVSRHNQALIVEAVNQHAAQVATLKEIQRVLDEDTPESALQRLRGVIGGHDEYMNRALAAEAKHGSLLSQRDALLTALKEMTRVTAIAMMSLDSHGIDHFSSELGDVGIADGFGVRAKAAIALVEGK